MKIKIESVRVTEQTEGKRRKDGTTSIKHGLRLEGEHDGKLTMTIRSESPIIGLDEGMSGLVVTIENPQTTFSLVVAGTTAGVEERMPDVMAEDRTVERKKGSKALDEMTNPATTPDQFAAVMDAEVKRLGVEADILLKAERLNIPNRENMTAAQLRKAIKVRESKKE